MMESFETGNNTAETVNTDGFIEVNELNNTSVKRRKRIPTGLLVLIIAICSIAFCAILFFAAEYAASGCIGNAVRDDVKFSEMEYIRPDRDDIIGKLDDIVDCVENNSVNISEKLAALQDINSDYYDIYTMYALATIKHSLDMTDGFYTDELNFYAEFLPEYSQKIEAVFVACAQSEYIETFEEKFFGEGTLEAYKDGGAMSDICVELSQRASETVNQYLIEYVNPTIEYNGKEVSLYDVLADESVSYDEYYTVLQSFYEKYNEIFGEMYVTLVKCNMRIADELGYDSYIDYAYSSYYRDYTPEAAQIYMDDIKEYIVPLFQQLYNDGWYESQYYSFDVTEDEVLKSVRTAADEAGGQISSIFDYMERNELYDLTVSDVKEQSSYTTYIYNYDAPYIFINSTGTDSDILTMAHEFGHFVESYINYGYDSGLDNDETASQGMEYLILSYLDSTLTKGEVNRLCEKKLLDTVDVFIYQGYYNEFETNVYSLDYEDVTLENINAVAADCAEDFGLTALELWEGYYAKSWIDIPHLFQSPFYVISYCTGCDVALQIYELAEEDPDNGVGVYLDLIDWDWDMTFIENVERVGLESPFEDGRLEDCASMIREYFY